MQEKVIWATELPSHVHNDEIGAEVIRISQEQNYPVEKVKLISKLEKYVGFAPQYMVSAAKRPAIPGGWDIEISTYEPAQKEIMLNVKLKNENGKNIGEINRLVLRMLDEYRKEGLKIEVEEEPKEFYGNWVRVLKAEGHPILLAQLEDFIENMR